MIEAGRRGVFCAILGGALGAFGMAPRARAADLPRDRIRVGKAITSSFPFAGLELGAEQGLWAAEGLEPTFSAFRGDGQMQQALAAGALDFGLGSGPAMGYAVKGVPAHAVAVLANQPQNMGLVVGAKSGVNSVDDLRGKSIGVTTAGSLTDWLARNIGRSRGWPEDTVDVVPMGEIRTRLVAMQAGELAGAVTAIEEAYSIQDAGQGKVLTNFGAIVPHFHTHVLFASDAMINTQPELVGRFLQAWFKTAAFMRDHRAETVKSVANTMKLSPQIVDQSYGDEVGMLSFDGHFDPQAVDVIRASLRDLGILDSVPPASALYVTKFVPVTLR